MEQCPMCFEALEARLVAPCYMCGGIPDELDHLIQNYHSYAVYRFPSGTEMELCEACYLDMGSIAGEHWGLPRNQRLTTNDLALVRVDYSPTATWDQYCSNCKARLAYLRALREILDAKENRNATLD